MASRGGLSAVGHLLDVSDLDASQSGSPNPSHRRRWLVALALAAAALVAAVVTLAWPSGSARRATAPAAPPAATALPHRSAASPPTAPLPTAVPTVGPAVTWQSFQGVVLPYSSTAGPTVEHGPVYAGYAHTPTGALIAAAQLAFRYFLTPSPGWRQVAAEQFMPGPGRDLYITDRTQVSDDVAPGQLAQIMGFRFLGYTPAQAVLDLVTRDTSGNLQSAAFTMDWAAGDWRLTLAPDDSRPTQVLPNLDGFTAWSGVS